MTDLVLCILSTSGIFLAFKYFKKFGVNTPMAIVVNYAVAACLGWCLAGGIPAMKTAVDSPWFFTAIIMGAGFLFLFNMIAYCTRELGIAVASVSTKLSFIIPATIFILVDPKDNLVLEKGIAFALAIGAIILSSFGKNLKRSESQTKPLLLLIVPAIIFLGSGGIDLVFGLNSSEPPLIFTSVPFTIAFITGMLIRVMPKHRHPITIKELIGGLALGITNFGSLYFLLGSYENAGLDKSAVIPTLNIGVIIFSTVGALILFNEKPNTKTTWGLVLGLFSICVFLLSF